ncbi:glycosyltransferase family 2 protein [Variovorax dokdonensis]|uniref:Glycosyltransferase family 2 protein n=2 Tax=Variovorax dokdonensis TaxID=344883 RepID=A0ABT7N9J5_9BURK|nr:glycosyltransferase family 2 protein [Variovorax dokdonensis]MDM0044618.1 glycosyltransferase family 2 protein [Variovorax dokdonensis]
MRRLNEWGKVLGKIHKPMDHSDADICRDISSDQRLNFASVSVVIPARNEAVGLATLLPELLDQLPGAEIILSDDGSTDGSSELARTLGAHVQRRPYGAGNGAAIKSGVRAATREWVVFMDGDGQHRAQDVARLVKRLSEGYEMVVGARNSEGQASRHRGLANAFYNRLASWMVGHPVKDLTSGFRVVRRKKFMEFLHLLPNGFSYPTTCTMAFFRAGYPVAYESINVQQRQKGTTSHVRIWRDGVRFLLIIFKIGTLYSPLKLFAPIAASFFFTGLAYYAYTYFTIHRFTNMSVLLFSASVIVFLIGLVSEQITALMYRDAEGT